MTGRVVSRMQICSRRYAEVIYRFRPPFRRAGACVPVMRALAPGVLLLLTAAAGGLPTRARHPWKPRTAGASSHVRCRGALRDSCSATLRNPGACSECIKAHAATLREAGCVAANISGYCAHGACKAAMNQIADGMKAKLNATTKDCLGALAAYGNQVTALGCNKSADPNDPLHLPSGLPSPTLATHCDWPLPCRQALGPAGCKPPDIRYDGALNPPQNCVNGTQRELCEACTHRHTQALITAGCGVDDLAAFCLTSLAALPGTGPSPGPTPSPTPGPGPLPPAPSPTPEPILCPGAIREAGCSNRTVLSDLNACTECVHRNAASLELAGCTVSELGRFCNHGVCKAAVANTCGKIGPNVTTKACLGCVAAYGTQIEAAGCNSSSAIFSKSGLPNRWVVEACTQRPCDAVLSDVCTPPTCSNAPQPWGRWCDTAEQNECVTCTANHSADLKAQGCVSEDLNDYCLTSLPTAPSYLCPQAPPWKPTPLPSNASKKKKIRWFSNGQLNTGCLLGKWNDITDGIIQCCNGFGLNSSGMFPPFDNGGRGLEGAPFGNYIAAGKRVYITISASTPQCTAPGLCTTVWANRDQIADALLSSALNTSISGYNLDWETAVPNDVACFVKLWGYVADKLRPHGLIMQTDIDNHAGGSGDPAPWGYLWNFVPMIPVFDHFTNMGTVSLSEQHCCNVASAHESKPV